MLQAGTNAILVTVLLTFQHLVPPCRAWYQLPGQKETPSYNRSSRLAEKISVLSAQLTANTNQNERQL